MDMAEKRKTIFISLMLLGIGIAAIVTGQVPAHNSKGMTPFVTSFPNTEPYVPVVGWLLVMAAIYMIVRTLYLSFKKK